MTDEQYAHVKEEIRRRFKRVADRCDVTQEKIMQEEARIAFLDPRELFGESWTLLTPGELPEDIARAIARIEVQTKGDDTHYRYWFHDKGQALARLEKILGMNAPEKHEHTGKDGGPIETSDTELATKLASLIATAKERRKQDE